jgi:hypothetical protein
VRRGYRLGPIGGESDLDFLPHLTPTLGIKIGKKAKLCPFFLDPIRDMFSSGKWFLLEILSPLADN